jgi:hypothetical protein
MSGDALYPIAIPLQSKSEQPRKNRRIQLLYKDGYLQGKRLSRFR